MAIIEHEAGIEWVSGLRLGSGAWIWIWAWVWIWILTVTWRLFQMVVALQGVGNEAVVMYTTTRSLWGQFVGPLSKVHAPWGMQHPPPLARKRGAMCEVLGCGREPQQA